MRGTLAKRAIWLLEGTIKKLKAVMVLTGAKDYDEAIAYLLAYSSFLM